LPPEPAPPAAPANAAPTPSATPLVAGGPVRARRLRVSLRIGVVAFSLFTVGLAALAVHLPWRQASRANVAELAEQLTSEIVSGVAREIDGLFAAAVAAQDAVHAMLRDGVIDIEDTNARERMFLSFLLANRHFSWVSYGKPNGDFYGAQRRDDANIRMVDSRWNGEKKEAWRTEQYLVLEGGEVRPTITRSTVNDYFSPQREWYRRAVAEAGHIWTGVYVFSVSRRPGLNAAIALRRGDNVAGVVSVAIELDRVSRYLAGVKTVRSGAAFIVDGQGRLVAFQDAREVTRDGKNPDEPELKPLAEAGHPKLRLAHGALKAEGIDYVSKRALSGHVETDARTGERFFVSLAPLAGRDWYVGIVIPEADLTAAVERNYTRLALLVGAALLLICLVAVLASRWLFVRPLGRIAAQTDDIAAFRLDGIRRVPSRIREIDALSGSIERMAKGLDSFRKYLPHELVRTLLARGVEARLGGERRTLSIMFMDLEGFTALSERLGHRMVPLLGEYFGTMSALIHARNGTIDKYIGDAVMAFWGAPTHNDDHAADACRAALDCAAAMARLRERWAAEGRQGLRVRIGINTGRVVVGNIGSEDRLNYTVLGDPVNLTSRVEGINKDYGTDTVITQHTWEVVRYDTVTRRLGSVTVRGREQPVALYELLAMRADGVEPTGYGWIAPFEKGLALFEDGRFEEAIGEFRRTIEIRGGDEPSRRYIERAESRRDAEKPPSVTYLRGKEPA
jgi:adenylate cyclase